MYSIENFRAFNVRCFSDPRTFFNSKLLSIYGNQFSAIQPLYSLYTLFTNPAPPPTQKCTKYKSCDVIILAIDLHFSKAYN